MKSSNQKDQIPYTRRRYHPQFHGMRRSSSALPAQGIMFNQQGDVTNSTLSSSLSDIWEQQSKQSAPDTNNGAMKSEKISLNPELDNAHSLHSGIQSRFSSSMQLSIPTHRPSNLEKTYHQVDDRTHETELKKAYNGNKRNMDLYIVSLSQSAASYYSRNLLQTNVPISEMCKRIDKLNHYLKSRKADLKAGVPGRYLHAVIGQEFADVGSVVSTIMYAYYLNETQKNSQLCTVPIINTKRAYLNIHNELKWLLDSCRVDESSLIFIDEIDLSYYDIFGDLKLVLLNGQKLPAKQEGLKEALVEIFNCKQAENQYPWVEEVTVAKDCSCCALVAEKFAETLPEILAGRGISRLLLSGILLDTANLTDVNCTSKDKYMATLLIKGAGRLGSNGLYQMLKYKMFDISDLKVRDILHRDFKKWTRVTGKPNGIGSRLIVSHIGMSSIGISVEQLLAHEDSAAHEVIQFQESEKLQLLMIASGYEDSQKTFKREILVSTTTAELMKDFIHFFNSHGTHMPLKALDRKDMDEMRVFEVDNMTSRRSIERLLEEFGGILRKQ